MTGDAKEKIVIRTPAKVNLFLGVLGKRPDGYHEILSVMQMIDLWDDVTLKRGEGLQVTCSGEGAPEGPENLAYKAAQLMREVSGRTEGVHLALQKGIPVAAGLGGGSSDAAAVLYGLNRLWGLGYPRPQLMEIGGRLGSDVPFFLSEGSVALAWGRGDRIIPLTSLEEPWLVLVNPGFPVSTAWAYGQVKIRVPGIPSPVPATPALKFGLTNRSVHIKIPPHPALQKRGAVLWVSPQNDLTEGVVPTYPAVARVLVNLEENGPQATLMSGSGPTVVGVFTEEEAACAAGKAMEQQGWRSWVVRCLRKSPYTL
jgi:4-diphosphocytidyl-2-C-methyl-D-erythritol kinase